LSGEHLERRLAAILVADVAGYSRLMGADEEGTARTLREHHVVTDALVEKHGGRLVKSTGDGVLLEFPSVVDAVECAVAVQAVLAVPSRCASRLPHLSGYRRDRGRGRSGSNGAR
jgi:class 3 adenylate cyclase